MTPALALVEVSANQFAFALLAFGFFAFLVVAALMSISEAVRRVAAAIYRRDADTDAIREKKER